MTAVLLASAMALGACGTSQNDRALSGAALGAAGGAALGTITGGSPIGGALLGGAAGAAGGYLTDSNDVDLGDPVWE
ncbi:MAG TPA: hypothetical protein VEH84_00845 [Alphaproteobacteria bacterium]|nr:hypothetical protein [Alphaproteobacteria bacterium]